MSVAGLVGRALMKGTNTNSVPEALNVIKTKMASMQNTTTNTNTGTKAKKISVGNVIRGYISGNNSNNKLG